MLLSVVSVSVVAQSSSEIPERLMNNPVLSECVCSLTYPGRKAHASYYTLTCGLCGTTISLSILLHKRQDFRGKNSLTIKMGFYFLYNICLQRSDLGRNGRYIIINVHRSSCKVFIILVEF